MFPLIIYTNKYNEQENLSIEEKKLLNAQIAFLEANFEKALEEARNLKSVTNDENIKYGCMVTQAISSIYAGNLEEWKAITQELQDIKKKEEGTSKELEILVDYYNIYLYKISDISPWLRNADFRGLDADVLPAAQLVFMVAKILESLKDQQAIDTAMLECICSSIEMTGIPPLTVYAHLMVAFVHKQQRNIEKATEHINYVIDPIIENRWLSLIYESYHMMKSCYDTILPKKDPLFYDKLIEMKKLRDPAWYRIYEYVNEDTKIKKLSTKELEIVLNLFRFWL